MFYVLEPQRNVSDKPDETAFRPCEVNEATIFALFSRESMSPDEDSEYVGDVSIGLALALINSAC